MSRNHTGLDGAALEHVYDALAEGIDAAGPRNEALFLARLVLLLADAQADAAAFATAVRSALDGLASDPTAPPNPGA